MRFQSLLNCKFSYSQESVLRNRFKNLIIDRHSKVTTISINRQKTRNSLDLYTINELSQVLDQIDDDRDTKVAILNGEGGSFCSGFDLKEVKEIGLDKLRCAAERLRRRPLCVKPIVCAVSGFTVAEGFELALACDLRVIEDTASLGFLGRRFGVPHSLDGGKLLSDLIGMSHAMDLTLTGRLITGETANAWGLAARVVATGTALGQSLNLAMSLPKFPQTALLEDKLRIVNSHLSPDCEDTKRNCEYIENFNGALEADVQEGADKFLRGIGRHGNFKNLTTRDSKPWESEE